METGAEAAKGCRCERGEKETKKTKNWSVLRNPGVVFRCRYSNKNIFDVENPDANLCWIF